MVIQRRDSRRTASIFRSRGSRIRVLMRLKIDPYFLLDSLFTVLERCIASMLLSGPHRLTHGLTASMHIHIHILSGELSSSFKKGEVKYLFFNILPRRILPQYILSQQLYYTHLLAIMTGFRERLNNVVLQYQRRSVQYSEPERIGAPHQCAWMVIVYIDGVEHGRGTAATKDQAKENAAREALVALGIPFA
ncbi:hypothetical protein BDZ94DRAFT_1326683 [Collybia nuda]|uniref:DRBM domain-containing protein n=1 Tax=Collybia nuda TaxID=64659 RepID=A0A9P5XWH9_9AGAR|nr:hypothetical protein BDZ94DRAFT_1326683 [Collybia nuda]